MRTYEQDQIEKQRLGRKLERLRKLTPNISPNLLKVRRLLLEKLSEDWETYSYEAGKWERAIAMIDAEATE